MCDQTLSIESVIQIHDHLARAFAQDNDPMSPAGVKSAALLEMAISRQHVGFGSVSKYPTAVRQVQQRRGGDDGWVYDVS